MFVISGSRRGGLCVRASTDLQRFVSSACLLHCFYEGLMVTGLWSAQLVQSPSDLPTRVLLTYSNNNARSVMLLLGQFRSSLANTNVYFFKRLIPCVSLNHGWKHANPVLGHTQTKFESPQSTENMQRA